jgi:membrane protein DedA with SNARE-associated domain
MSQMSPLAKFLMLILRNGSIGAVVLLVLFAGILFYQKITPDGHLAMTRQDWSFLGVLVALFLLAVYLVKAIAKEINKPGE